MKKIVLLFVFLIFCVSLFIYLYTFIEIPNNHYLRAIQDKQKLLNETPSPRIVLVGGSNLALGIESEQFKEKLNLNPINLGLHADLGYEYMIKSTIPGIKENDIIILIPEYEYILEKDFRTKELLMAYTIESESFCFYNYYERLNIASLSFFGQIQRNIRQRYNGYDAYPIDTIYNREGFNSFGDLVNYYSFQKNKKPLFDKICFFTVKQKQYFEFNDLLISEAKMRNATVYITYPCLPKSVYCKKSVDSYKEAITEKYESIIIGTPEDFIFDDSLFFDSRYHMTEEGKKTRTAKLSELIITALQTKPEYSE